VAAILSVFTSVVKFILSNEGNRITVIKGRVARRTHFRLLLFMKLGSAGDEKGIDCFRTRSQSRNITEQEESNGPKFLKMSRGHGFQCELFMSRGMG
jgi:hypothetical protein